MNAPLEIGDLSMSKASWELADMYAKRLNISRDAAVEFVLANFDPQIWEERLHTKTRLLDHMRTLVERYSAILEGQGLLVSESVAPDAGDESEG